MITFRSFTIETDRDVSIKVSLDPVSPRATIFKNGAVVDNLQGQPSIAAMCTASLLSTLEMLSNLADEVGAPSEVGFEQQPAGAKVIPLNDPDRFSNLEI